MCLGKLRWNIELDELAREKALAAVLDREGIADEARWSAERLLWKRRDEPDGSASITWASFTSADRSL